MNKIAVVIPVHNRLTHTIECLEILENQKDTLFFKNNNIFTIVSDDGSTDGTSDYIKMNYPEVIVLKGNGNLWWSGTMNIAIKHALEIINCDLVLLWENDISPFPEYFDNLQKILTRRQEKDIICSKIYYQINSNKIFAMGGIFNPKTGYKELIGSRKDDCEEFEQIKNVDWFCGQGILIHKSVFSTIGFFDEKVFPQYHGDSDFAFRAKKAGFINLVYPELKITNDTSTTGISHLKNKTFKQFFVTLYSIRSNYSIAKNIRFYNRHTTSIRAYMHLVKGYYLYIGGFLKWKFLGMFGIQKEYDESY